MITISETVLQNLKDAARKAARVAHVPYSGFQVGAAVLHVDGVIRSGCNVENASYGLTNCAERTALFNAVTDGWQRSDFVTLLLYTPGDVCHSPCGACRQVMSEFLMPATPVYSTCDSGKTVEWTMESLLPDSFNLPGVE